MKNDFIKILTGVIVLGSIVSVASYAQAEGDTKISATIVPLEYISVKGDAEKFRAQTWKNDGYSGGLEDILATGMINKDTSFSFEGHALSNTNDYGGDLEIKKQDLGFLKIDYDIFRKYYDGTGGTYYPFTTLSAGNVDRDFRMDIGHMGFEIGGVLGNLPEISFFYNQHTKDGVKSRLSWTAAKEGSTTKMIGPAWQDIDESVNSFGLRSHGDLAGFAVKGEQKWEVLNEKTIREEKSLSTNATASEKKIRRQTTELDSNSSVTTLHGEKWFWEETGMMAVAYRHSQIDNKEHASLRETDEYGNPRSFTYPENKYAGVGDNKLSSDIVTGNFQSHLMKDLLFNAKLKTEIINRHGGSSDPSDTTNPPNGIPNTTEVSMSESKVDSWGGDLGLRYSGFKKTSIYGDVEVGRVNNWLYENRDSIAGESAASVGEIFFRETDVYTTKVVLTAGTRTVLSKYLNFTTQIRHKMQDSDYDDKRESVYSAGAKSAFMDFLQLTGTELTTKWTVKPVKRVTGSLRYQYADNDYVTRTEDSFNQRALTISHTFTYDLILQPLDSLLIDLGYMRQLAKTSTPADRRDLPLIPGFTSNVNTWMMSSSYIFTPKMSFNTTFSKASQDNYNDFTVTGLPYGVDASWYDATIGLKWLANKVVSVEPKYTYYNYQENAKSGADAGYSAHAVWLGVNLNWL
jgi:hypothetical protein